MPIEFNKSETKHNLLRAFAGESQARNRYTFAASAAKKQNLHVIEQVFLFTANQEKEHAEIFYKFLSEFAGQNIGISGDYPIDIFPEPVQLLRKACSNEYAEYERDYPSFEKVAQEEGFSKIASAFNMIAQIEKGHGDRFAYYANLIDEGKLFISGSKTKWLCLNCGQVHEGLAAPETCPVCEHNQGYFIRMELAPYSKNW